MLRKSLKIIIASILIISAFVSCSFSATAYYLDPKYDLELENDNDIYDEGYEDGYEDGYNSNPEAGHRYANEVQNKKKNEDDSKSSVNILLFAFCILSVPCAATIGYNCAKRKFKQRIS